jgi:hypothetical protein
MNEHRISWRVMLWVFITSISLGCAALSGAASTVPLPPTKSLATPSSPMAGDWTVVLGASTVIITIDPTGSTVTNVHLTLNDWKCGGNSETASTDIRSDAWTVSPDGQLSLTIDLNPDDIEILDFEGQYSRTKAQFSGTWQEDWAGSHCSGKWVTSAHH